MQIKFSLCNYDMLREILRVFCRIERWVYEFSWKSAGEVFLIISRNGKSYVITRIDNACRIVKVNDAIYIAATAFNFCCSLHFNFKLKPFVFCIAIQQFEAILWPFWIHIEVISKNARRVLNDFCFPSMTQVIVPKSAVVTFPDVISRSVACGKLCSLFTARPEKIKRMNNFDITGLLS